MITTAATFAPAETVTADGWQPVTLAQWDDAPVWDAFDAHTGEHTGTVCEWTPGLWQAHRTGYATATAATWGEALAAVDWLATVTAAELAATLATNGPAAIVLADGTAATADQAHTEGFGLSLVTLRLDVQANTRVELAAPAPVGALRMAATVPAGETRAPRLTATFTACTLVALAPACTDCQTAPGQPCEPFAAHL